MKKKIGVLLSLIILAIGSLFFVQKNNGRTIVSAETQTEFESTYLYDGVDVYKSTAIGGRADGYGTYTVGQTATMHAVANDGFELVGWRVKYSDGTVQFVTTNTNSTFNSTDPDYETDYKMTYSLNFQDNIGNDGKNDTCQLNVGTCKVDMTINPVFSYIYYDVVIDDSQELKLTNEITIGGDKLYYQSSSTDGGVTTYTNAIVKSGDNYKYYGNLYEEDESYYTLHDKNAEGQTAQIKVDYSKGSFRLGESVDLNLNIADGNYIDIRRSKIHNAKVSGLAQKSLVLTAGANLIDGEFKREIDETLLNSTVIKAKFNIEKEYIKSTYTYFDFEFDSLYKVTLDFKIDDENVEDNYLYSTENLYGILTDNVRLDGYFSKFDDSNRVYLVKSSVPVLSCKRLIQDDSNTYSYYNLVSIKNATKNTTYGDNPAQLGNIQEDTIIQMDYESVDYNITYKYMLDDGEGLKEMDRYFTKPSEDVVFTINRGQTKTLKKANIIESYGYNYLRSEIEGSAISTNLNENDLDVEVSKDQPQNIIVLMIYSHVDFKIKIEQASVGFMLGGAYPIYEVGLNLTRDDGASKLRSSLSYSLVNEKKEADFGLYYEWKDGVMTKSSEISGNTFNATNTYYLNNVYGSFFSLYAHIGDGYAFDSVVTNDKAFSVTGYRIKGASIPVQPGSKFDEGTLRAYANANNEIVVYALEDYKTYNLTYKIEVQDDMVLDTDPETTKDILMGKIGLNYDAVKMSYVTISAKQKLYDGSDFIEGEALSSLTQAQVDGYDYIYEIVVSNLRYNDSLKLKAAAKEFDENADGVGDYYFVLNSFLRDGQNYRASETTSSGDVIISKLDLGIQKDEIVTAVFSKPNTTLMLSFEDPALNTEGLFSVKYYDEDTLVVFGTDETQTHYVKEGIYYVSSGTRIRISLVKEKIKFGYKFTGLRLADTHRLTTTVTQYLLNDALNQIEETSTEYIFETEMTGEHQYNAELLFEEVSYRVKVIQNGAGLTDSTYMFEANDYLLLTVADLSLRLDLPQYHYISEVLFPSAVNNSDYVSTAIFGQTNNDLENEYEFDFNSNLVAFETLASYGERKEGYIEIVIKVVYEIHKSNLDINYEIPTEIAKSIKDMIFNQFPDITNNDYAKEYIKESNQIVGVRFVDIPFGVAPSFTVGTLMGGLKHLEGSKWADGIETYITLGDDLDAFIKDGHVVLVDGKLTLLDKIEIDLIKYLIKTEISYDGERAELQDDVRTEDSVVATPEELEVTLYGSFNYYANANQNNGIKFKSMHYYTKYSYIESNWEADRYNLYYYDDENEKFVLNTNAEYDGKQYYTQVQVDNSNFRDNAFMLGNYAIVDNTITLFVQYTDYLFDLDIHADATNKESISKLGIEPGNYANYSIMTDTGFVGQKLRYKDKVTLTVTLKNTPYDLKNGISLTKAKITNFECTLTDNLDGSYDVEFEVVADIIKLVIENKLRIDLTYGVANKVVEYRTNILDGEFFTGSSRMLLAATNDITNETVNVEAGNYRTDISYGFLSTTVLTFELKGSHAEYFVVYGYDVLDEDGNKIAVADYARYGISDYEYNDAWSGVICQHICDEKISIVLKVAPIIYLNPDNQDGSLYEFNKYYRDNDQWIGLTNGLSTGNTNAYDVNTSAYISSYMKLIYYKYDASASGNKGNKVVDNGGLPVNAGKYIVEIDFGEENWWKYMRYDYVIILNILPKEISISYDSRLPSLQKNYDGSSSIDQEGNTLNSQAVKNYLTVIKDSRAKPLSDFVPGSGPAIKINELTFHMVRYDMDNNEIIEFNANAERKPYSIRINNVELLNNPFNSNYTLVDNEGEPCITTSILVSDKITVYPREIRVVGVKIYDKVYDGNRSAQLYLPEGYELEGILDQDKNELVFSIDFESVQTTFDDEKIGAGKRVVVDFSEALRGTNRDSYKISTIFETASIYPYSISAEVADVGTIIVLNKRGLEEGTKKVRDMSLIPLIPIDATLQVKLIRYESDEYMEIYEKIAPFLRGRKYETGFNLSFSLNNASVSLDNKLFVVMPSDSLSHTLLFTSDDSANELVYTTGEEGLMIDLSQNEGNMKAIVMLTDRTYLKWWQITLIVTGIVGVVGSGLATFLVLRFKKRKQYREKETI